MSPITCALIPFNLSHPLSLFPSVSHPIIAGTAAAVVVWCKQAFGTNIPLFINVLMWGRQNYIIFAVAPSPAPRHGTAAKKRTAGHAQPHPQCKGHTATGLSLSSDKLIGPHTHTPMQWLSMRRSGVVYSAVIPWHVALAI